ncbi:MAG: toprim domain-containing protein [Turicibacter sp.]|nr:toprim domain-containing protein [Turicibacter sp.]
MSQNQANQVKEYLKEQLVDFLEERNINIRKNFICLNPEHLESTPSMSYDARRNKVHCFGCGADYDIFNLIGIEYGLDGFQSQFNKACELYDVEVEQIPTIKPTRVRPPQNKRESEDVKMSTIDYYKACEAAVHQTSYFKSRGLSNETIKNFSLGYDATERRAIIPVTREFYISRSVSGKGFYNPSGVKSTIYHKTVKDRNKPIFVVESAFCALSIAEVGGNAIALNSTNNSPQLIELIKEQALYELRFVLSLDNDKTGREATYNLMNELRKLNVECIDYNVSDEFKDPNELLVADASRLKANVAEAEQEFEKYLGELKKQQEEEAEQEFEKRLDESKKQQEEEAQRIKAEYQATSALGHLQGFIDDIATIDTNYIPTGFSELDRTLGGGLFEGLYFIGALSSLGKTTFTLQVADRVAQQGHDVLIISLEMARSELMAKSISRLTFTVDSRYAKTTRGITTAAYYKHYSDEERACINQAINEYATYAEHIFITESVGNTTVDEVRRLIDNHVKITGNKPLVVIDYVQILRPLDPRMSDKQAVDYNVMELKRISRDFKIPIIGISSLNRQSYKEKISMTSFKESGAIEYSSDILIGLQFKDAGDPKFDVDEAKAKDERQIELVILKNRNGKTGVKIGYTFIPKFNSFDETGVRE